MLHTIFLRKLYVSVATVKSVGRHTGYTFRKVDEEAAVSPWKNKIGSCNELGQPLK